MPLVCISLMKGQPNGFGKKVGVIVYQSMLETINIPAKDNFQIITELDSNTLIYDASYLDIRRSDAIIVIQITLNEVRLWVEFGLSRIPQFGQNRTFVVDAETVISDQMPSPAGLFNAL